MKKIRLSALLIVLSFAAVACSAGSVVAPDCTSDPSTCPYTPGTGNYTPGTGNYTPGTGNYTPGTGN
jgi:hypothetical protein